MQGNGGLVFFASVLVFLAVDTRGFSAGFSGVSPSRIRNGVATRNFQPNIPTRTTKHQRTHDHRYGDRCESFWASEGRLFSASGQDTTDAGSPSPEEGAGTGKKILALAVPALGALLVDPLLTIADTAFVGRYSTSPYELAGMGSASALLTFSFYVFNFLCTATTPLVASKRASGDEAGALAVGGQALSLALGLGTMLSGALVLGQGPLLDLMGAGARTEGNEYASGFLAIRALAAPAVFCISASTGILRGYLDTKTPIVVLFLANAVNFGLDVFLITILGLGPMGAAIATTTAEWISALLFLFVLAGKLPSADGELGKKEDSSGTDALAVLPSLSIPAWEDVRPLIVASSSVFARSLVLQLFLTAAAAFTTRDSTGSDGASFISAHQIAIQLWMLCSYVSDALAAASQGLVADAIGRKADDDVREISKTVFVYSAFLGVFLAGLLYIGFYPTESLIGFFTSDEGTQKALLEIAFLIVVSQPLNSLVFAADGVLQGASEFPYQAKSMALSGFVGSLVFFGLQSTGQCDNLFAVWASLICLQLMRGITSAVKIVDDNGPIRLLLSEEDTN